MYADSAGVRIAGVAILVISLVVLIPGFYTAVDLVASFFQGNDSWPSLIYAVGLGGFLLFLAFGMGKAVYSQFTIYRLRLNPANRTATFTLIPPPWQKKQESAICGDDVSMVLLKCEQVRGNNQWSVHLCLTEADAYEVDSGTDEKAMRKLAEDVAITMGVPLGS